MNTVKKLAEDFVVFLHKKYNITPNKLTYSRIFAAPWLALLVTLSITGKSLHIVIFTLFLYILVVVTDFLDGILARHLSKSQPHDHSKGGMLDRISDKLLIIFLLIPFGVNLFTVSIILGESLLAYQAISSPSDKKGATRTGKIKMLLQTLAIPILVLYRATNSIPFYFFVIFQILTIILTYMSVYSHFVEDDTSHE